MTTGTRLGLAVMLCATMGSCFSDDGIDEIPVQYRVTVQDPLSGSFSYMQGNGHTMASAALAPGEAIWHITEYTDKDIDALLAAQFSNTSDHPLNYTLHLFADGKLVVKKQGTVLPGTQASSEARYFISR